MTGKLPDRNLLGREYGTRCEKYRALALNLHEALKKFINDAGIDVLDVQYRIKDFDSFYEKLQRKEYRDPFKEIEDICGLRVICYYPSDLEKISKLIEREFRVLESTDKADLLEPDRFGYRSLHFIVSIKKEWSNAPNYRGQSDLKAEIQVRTILMHAWADVEHKLAYKKREHVPPQLRRKLSQLSALFEVADQQLDSLREEKEEYKQSILTNVEKSPTIGFDPSQGLNIDNLQAVLDFHFSDRKKSPDVTSLLDELLANGVAIKDIENGYHKVKDILPESEKEILKYMKVSSEPPRFTQVGIVRHILDLTHDAWRRSRYPDLQAEPAQLRKWRSTLSSRQSKLS